MGTPPPGQTDRQTDRHLTASFPGQPGKLSAERLNQFWFNEARDNEVAVTSAGPYPNHYRQTTTPASHHSVFTGRMLFLTSNQQRQSTEGSSKHCFQLRQITNTSHTPLESSRCCSLCAYKNSSGDEIANVNFYAVHPESYQICWNNAK